jgi:hypothetical protein
MAVFQLVFDVLNSFVGAAELSVGSEDFRGIFSIEKGSPEKPIQNY